MASRWDLPRAIIFNAFSVDSSHEDDDRGCYDALLNVRTEPVPIPREKACTVSQIVAAHLEDCGLSVKDISKLIVSTEGAFCSQYLTERPLFRIAR